MGEQTQTQTQTQTLSQQPDSHGQPQESPLPSSSSTPSVPVSSISSTTIAPTSTSPAELSNAPSQTFSPPSKIPFRPRKIRKLSPENPNPNPTNPKAKPSATRAIVAAAPPPRIPTRSLSCDGEVEIALRHLRAADPLLAPLIDAHQPPTFDSFHTPFLALAKSILYQQLAYKAGTSIYTRFVALCGGEAGVIPDAVLSLTPQQLRQIGVSGRKASYLHDLARKYQNGILSDAAIVNMDDKSLFTMLTMVNGIGSWSVHMFMIFSLHRPDVLPINDLGVRKGVQMLYGLEDLPRPSQMDQLCDKWRPYRSVAAWYMWRFVEQKGTPSSAAAVVAGTAGTSLQQQQQPPHMHVEPPPQQQQSQQPQPQQQQQQQQILDPLNILNIGSGTSMDNQFRACAWGQ